MASLILAYAIGLMQLVVASMALTLAFRWDAYGMGWVAGAFFLMALQRMAAVPMLVNLLSGGENTRLEVAVNTLWLPALITFLLLIGMTVCLVQTAHLHLFRHHDNKHTQSHEPTKPSQP